MPYAAGLLIFALSAAGVAWSRARTGEFCSPFSVVVAAWGSTFGLFLLRFLPYRPLSFRASAVLALGVACLLTGILLAPRLDRQPNPRTWVASGGRWWALAYGVLGLLGSVWFVGLVHQRLGWRALVQDAARVRYALVTYEIPSRFLFLQFFCIAAPLLAAALVLAGHRLRWWTWGVVAASFAGTFVTTDRTQFFLVLLTVAFMWLYRRGASLSALRLALLVGVAGGVLAVNFVVIGYWVGKTPDVLGTRPWVSEVGSADRRPQAALISRVAGHASGIYLYATGAYPAFGAYVDGQPPTTHGMQMLYPVVRLLQRSGLAALEVPSAIPPSTLVVNEGGRTIGFNAYTYLYYPFQDFRATGVAGYSLVIGLITGIAYQRVRRARGSPLHLLIIGQLSTALALSVFVNKFNNTAAWYVFALTTAPFLLPRLLTPSRRHRSGPP